VSEDDVLDSLYEYLGPLVRSKIYDNAFNSTFLAKYCTVYTWIDDHDWQVYCYVGQDGYVIGLDRNKTDGSEGERTVYTYEWSAPAKHFAFDTDYRGCTEPAYETPKNKFCSNLVTYTPKEFPCAYHVSIEEVQEASGSVSATYFDEFYYNNGMLRIETKAVVPDQSETYPSYQIIKKEAGHYREHSVLNGTCKSEPVDESFVRHCINDIMQPFNTEEVFYSVKEGTLDDKKCQIYDRDDTYEKETLYVNKDGYIIGIDSSSKKYDWSKTLRAKYEWSASAKNFAYDSEITGCDQDAYNKPSNVCSGSSVTASIAAIVVAIALEFYSLF